MSEQTTKKKKSLVKRLLKWMSISFFAIILVLILVPVLFKDQIKDLVLDEANKMLKADVALEDFDLTFISSFPKMTLQLDGISVTGRDEFEGVKLADIQRFDAHLGFWSVIRGDDIEIKSIALHDPKFDVRILQDGTANYDIMKTEEEIQEEYPEEAAESAPFNLRLSHYEINNAFIRYDDVPGDMFAEIVKLTHSGNGDLSADVIDFETKTTIEALTYRMEGISYLSEVKTDLVMNLLMEFKEGSDKFTLKENELKLNNLALSFDGYYEMLEGHDDMDIVLKADKTTFKDVLSLVPAFYHTGYESMLASGSMKLNGFVKGKMDEVNMPAFNLGLQVSEAGINYPDMPGSVDKISLDVKTSFPGGSDLDQVVVDMKSFHAEFVENTIDAKLFLKNPMTDPYVKSSLIANVDLATVDQVYPLAEKEKLNGVLLSDLFLEGRMSTIEEERYEDFKANGSLKLTEMHYQSQDIPDGVDISEMKFLFSPENLTLEKLSAKMGASDFQMDGTIDNYMGYMFKEEALAGVFNFSSSLIDVDALMPDYAESETPSSESTESADEVVPESSSDVEPMLVPGNIDFVLNTKIDVLRYDGLDIKDINGKVSLKEEVARLDNLQMNTLGGKVGLSGLYKTVNKSVPQVEFAYDLEQIDIQSLVEYFPSVVTMASVSKHAYGNVSSRFNLVGDLQPDFTPVYNSLTGEGTLSTAEVEIKGYEPIERLQRTVEIEQLKNTKFKNVNVKFVFKDGKVEVDPFNLKMGNISTTISGTTSFEQEIDYSVKMLVPKSAIPSSILATAEKAISAAQKIPGFKMKELPAMIPVNALITNTVTDPKIKTDFKEQLMELGGDVKGAGKDLIDDTVEKAKDSVKAIVDEKVEDVKDDLKERRDKLINDAQKRADQVVSEAQKLADKTRQEADKNAQKIIDEAGNNPLKKKAAELAANKTRKSGEDAALKIEREAKEKADAIMKEAREKASRLD
jgi:hypothetical protein